MEQYFSVSKIDVGEQVDIIVMCLTGDVKLQWRTRVKDDLNVGQLRNDTQKHLKQELKEQFMVNKTSWIA